MRLRIFKYLESYFLPCFWGACFVVNEIQLSPNLGTVMIPTNPSNQFYMILAKTGHVSFRSKVNANLFMLCPSVWTGSMDRQYKILRRVKILCSRECRLLFFSMISTAVAQLIINLVSFK